jgi:hypothetical protein
LGYKGFRIKEKNGEEICYWVWGWDNGSAPAAPGRAGRSRGGIGARMAPSPLRDDVAAPISEWRVMRPERHFVGSACVVNLIASITFLTPALGQ